MTTMRNRRGFTLIETLVAITILMLSVAGPLSVAQSAFTAAAISRDQLVASYLAQEQIEYVRELRDSAYLAAYASGDTSTAWSSFTGAFHAWCAGGHAICEFDPTAPTPGIGASANWMLHRCAAGTCDRLYLQASNVYSLNHGGTETPYTRSLTFTSLTPTEAEVVSTVSFPYAGSTHTVTVVDHLTAWQ